MVVTAGDSYAAEPGFADDAPDAMPEFSDDAMPMESDIAALPDEVFEDGAATPEPEPFSVDSLSLSPEQLTALDSYYRESLTPELQAAFTERERLWDEQKSSLEGKVQRFDADRLKASAWHAAARETLLEIMQDYGADQTQVDAINYRIQARAGQKLAAHAHKLAHEQTQAQQVQQAQTELQATFQSEVDRVRSLMHAHAQSVGLDPKHETINQEFDELVVAAAEAYFDDPANPKLKKAFESAKAMHKKRVTELGEMSKRRKAAKPANDALNRQRGRGPQNLSRGGNGAAPMSLKDHIAAIQQQNASTGQRVPYEEVYQIATQRYYQQQAQR
jgi:hypothetical protein